MKNNLPDKQGLIDAILASSGGKINRNNLNAAANGDMSGILSALSPDDRQKLLGALSDKTKAQQLLNSEAAKSILALFANGGKGNG